MKRPRITLPRLRPTLPSRQRLVAGWRGAVSNAVSVARALGAARDDVAKAWDGDRTRRRVVGGIADANSSEDRDGGGWRSLTGRSANWELSPDARRRTLDAAGQLYRSNPLVKSATDIGTSFVVGDGFTVTSEDKDVQAVIDRHWYDQTFEYWPTAQVSRVRILGLTGLLVLRRVKGDDGVTRLNYLSPSRVTGYELDPMNGASIIGVQLAGSKPSERLTLRTIITGNESKALSEKARRKRERWPDGVFVCNVNQIEPGDMGLPDCMSGFDVADWLTTFLEVTLASVEYQSNVVADIEIDGLTEEQLDELRKGKLKEPPPPGVPFVHNKQMQLKWTSPDLKAPDRAALFGMFLNQFSRSCRIPPFMLAHPDDTNRATALEMGSPALRGFAERHALFARFIEQIIDDQLRWAEACNILPVGTSLKRGLYTVNCSPLSRKDTASNATAMASLTASLVAGVGQGFVSQPSAGSVYVQGLNEFAGADLDAAKEAAAVLGAPRPALPAPAAPETPEAPPINPVADAVAQTKASTQAAIAEQAVVRSYTRARARKAAPPPEL